MADPTTQIREAQPDDADLMLRLDALTVAKLINAEVGGG